MSGVAVAAAGAAAAACCLASRAAAARPQPPPELEPEPEPEPVTHLETAPAAKRLVQARGRPSPWHWHSTASAEPQATGAALLAAAASGDTALLESLLDQGADIHCCPTEAGATTSHFTTEIDPPEGPVAGWTPFHVACRLGRTSCVQYLVRCGCDTSMETTDGRTGRDLASEGKST